MLVSCIPIFTGCEFNVSSGDKLKTPKVTLNSNNMCLTWSEIYGADGYDIYCNDNLSDSIDATENSSVIYDFSSLLGDNGEYQFYVIATTKSIYKVDSNASTTVTYTYSKKTILTPDVVGIDDSNKITYTLNNGKLSYIPLNLDNAEYLLYLYSNSTGLNTYTLTSTYLDLTKNNYITKDEIYAVRLGYKVGEVSKVASDILYYNPDDLVKYTSNVYLFDGYINDFYIKNIQELNNLVYYTFIYRIEQFDIKISDDFKSFVNSSFSGSTLLDKMDEAISYAFRSFYETIAYSSNNALGRFASYNGNTNEYTIKVSYGGVKECDTTIKPMQDSIYPQSISTPYYETVSYTTLAEEYGNTYNFASDQQFLYTTVTTSEQLYWAVENKVTPVFNSTSSSAYVIYSKAKSVILDIISDEMSEYEKALSLFDYITVNTNYDYTQYTRANYSSSIASYPTKLPCFYLEGVFETGYSVCDGFSKAYSLLCNMLGIDCIRIVGDAITPTGSGGHAWNKVAIDIDPDDDIPAKYYLVDITWTELISSDAEETLCHSFFGLSDADVQDTHFPYKNRALKFDNYASPDNLYYYTYQTFTYKGIPEDLVVKNDIELKRMFDYLLLSSNKSIEVVFDYDYMVSVYEKTYGEGSYLSGTGIEKDYYPETNLIKYEYNKATDVMTYYSYQAVKVGGYTVGYEVADTTVINYYKLKSTFTQIAMKSAKFDEQYVFLVNENELRTYTKDNKTGVLYVIFQNLLVDDIVNTNEIEHIVDYFTANNVTGEYFLYVENQILQTGVGSTELEKITNLFSNFTTNSDLKFEFELLTNSTYVGNSASASKFKMTVTKK